MSGHTYTHTHTHTYTHTYTHDNYYNPRCAHAHRGLTRGQSFTKLDFTAAYQQMMVDEESAKPVTVNTHQGLYQFYCLPFGVVLAPTIFQRVLVLSHTDEHHLKKLEEVLHRLKHQGIKPKRKKCYFFKSTVKYLDH